MKQTNRKTPGKREQKKQPAAKKRAAAQSANTKIVQHAIYGEVPFIAEIHTFTRPNGEERQHTWWRPDPSFRPKLPPKAIPADLSKQNPYYMPTYYYLDQEKVCVQCGQPFIFSGKEQKFWYETLQFDIGSVAIRCKRCRRQRRTGRAHQQQLSEAIHLAEEQPNDPAALLTLARTTVEYFAHFQSGNLDRGIAAAHRALKLAPMLHEALYWEARCQEAAGRRQKASDLYGQFIELQSSNKRQRPLIVDAAERKAQLEHES